jgi:hypothetical protein
LVFLPLKGKEKTSILEREELFLRLKAVVNSVNSNNAPAGLWLTGLFMSSQPPPLHGSFGDGSASSCLRQ